MNDRHVYGSRHTLEPVPSFMLGCIKNTNVVQQIAMLRKLTAHNNKSFR